VWIWPSPMPACRNMDFERFFHRSLIRWRAMAPWAAELSSAGHGVIVSSISMPMPATGRASENASCGSQDLASMQSTAIDSELLECQDCKRAYEVKYQPDGTARLVSV